MTSCGDNLKEATENLRIENKRKGICADLKKLTDADYSFIGIDKAEVLSCSLFFTDDSTGIALKGSYIDTADYIIKMLRNRGLLNENNTDNTITK